MWDLQNLFLRHARDIDRFLRRRGHNPETAADLTQDTFMRVLVANPHGPNDNPKAYLHQVARNLSVDLKRRERHVQRVDLTEQDLHRIADLSPSQETVVYDRQRLVIIEKAIGELPEKTRRAFELHRLGEKPIVQVAEELRLSTTRTWTLIRRAYRHLRDRLHGADI